MLLLVHHISVQRKSQTVLTHVSVTEGEYSSYVCLSVTVCGIQTSAMFTDKDILTKTDILNTRYPVACQVDCFIINEDVCDQGDALYPLTFFLS